MIIVIVGPTGVGKTKMSIELAKKYNAEIINCDSTQVYRGMNIATAKITEEEKEGIIHHLFDICDITCDYTVFDYQRDCRNIISDILDRGKNVIMVGGTGLYIKACLYDYNFSSSSNIDYSDFSTDFLYERLLKIDPNTSIHKNNRKRIERTLSIYDSTGSICHNKTDKLLYDCIFIGLTCDRDILYSRINGRVFNMIDNGLIEEARSIYDSNIRSKAVMTPIGYKELFLYFDGKISLNEAIELIQKNSRHYAKRQYTWFNNQMSVRWFNVSFNCFNDTVIEVSNYIDESLCK